MAISDSVSWLAKKFWISVSFHSLRVEVYVCIVYKHVHVCVCKCGVMQECVGVHAQVCICTRKPRVNTENNLGLLFQLTH